MELITIGSSSAGNAYALRAGNGEILLLEAGIPFKEVKRAIGYKTSKVVACLVSHRHQDHAKYIPEYVKAGITVYSNDNVSSSFPDCCVKPLTCGATSSFGGFRATPFWVEHDDDAPNYGYLVHHDESGTLFFATDCYNMRQIICGCTTYLCECNYEDGLLNKAVDKGRTMASQADRIRLSHMSLAHGVQFLQYCHAWKTAKQIILIHGSSRHLDPDKAVSKFQQVLGVPTFYARPKMIINL